MIKTLSDLEDNTEATIIKIRSGKRFKKRMEDLGFLPDTKIKKISDIYRGPVLISIKGSKIAIGRGEAVKVLVETNE